MKLSYNWLNDYVDLKSIDIKDLINRLTLATCEVEEVTDAFPGIAQLIIARIVSCEKHPQADRLQICQVDAGKFQGKIVCGAPNARPGILVPFAPVGATLPGKDGKGMTIGKANIRGVESHGMLASAAEVGLDRIFAGEGLLELTDIPGALAGHPLTSIFPADLVITIDNKSITNRPDLWCHFGFAREIAAIYKKKIKFHPLDRKLTFKPSKLSKKILVEKGSALAYFGAVCEGTRVLETPVWMKLRLGAVGQKSINNIVDASNYAMLELAQPNHTFDLNTLKQNTVTVALSDSKSPDFKTLDGESRKLPPGTVLIFDGDKKAGKSPLAVALGGIMGGEHSAIQPDTGTIFIESATFPRELIRRTLKKIDLRTDSAMRFEKGQDPAKAKPTIYRIAELLRETCPDLKLGPVTGQSVLPKKSKIKVTTSFLQARLGFAVTSKEISTTLTWLGYDVKSDKTGKTFQITAPTYRSQYDITIPEDIVEELGRVHGYDHIAPVPPVVPVLARSLDHARLLERRMKRLLADAGFSETLNYSFVKEEDNLLFGKQGLALLNPLAGLSHMRLSLIPGVLHHLAANQDRYAEVRLFEFGRVYDPTAKSSAFLHSAGPAHEEKRICVAMITDKIDASAQEESFAWFRETVREMAGASARQLDTALPAKKDSWGIASSVSSLFHPSCQVVLKCDGEAVGFIGMLHPVLAERFGIRRTVLVAEISFDLIAGEKKRASYKPPSVYPDSVFEVTVILEEAETTRRPVDVVMNLGAPEIHSMELTTIYRGAPIAEGKKAASYKIRCRKADGTITAEEWRPIFERVIDGIESAGMPLRR